jgi:hypothetical protein
MRIFLITFGVLLLWHTIANLFCRLFEEYWLWSPKAEGVDWLLTHAVGSLLTLAVVLIVLGAMGFIV